METPIFIEVLEEKDGEPVKILATDPCRKSVMLLCALEIPSLDGTFSKAGPILGALRHEACMN
jgi:hypothetical protein